MSTSKIVTMNCSQCHKKFKQKNTRQKFCSQSCAAVYNNTNNRPKKDYYCLECKSLLQNNRKFCNNNCWTLFRNKEKTELITSGLVSRRPVLKDYLTEHRGYKCECCGLSSWNNKIITLQLDHIDGNSDNNFPDNLRLLCPNCHFQTETYSKSDKSSMKMTKRNIRNRKYYNEGKWRS
jgi:hypothetical protein